MIDLIPKDGLEVDLQRPFACLAPDASTKFLFGESVGSLSLSAISQGAQRFLKAHSCEQMIVGRKLQLPPRNILTNDRKFQNARSAAHQFVDGYTAKAREVVQGIEVSLDESTEKPKRNILAHILIKETTTKK